MIVVLASTKKASLGRSASKCEQGERTKNNC